ncbi:hypothetical protein P2G88_12710 [Aliiglaciecola sp. CAU 1673]|uniref:hypothetical protein n=1 Tax=Aliiglaciecola sp. CAU 1673 TaxID=3032595 RepID=UPI0023DA30DB|nr:hypothetical protein [Aliiglaciecola sp. CAU 1673]MDF2179113.1 hypothetical protein [Aliiglaciecola sp. CAU 1673]
MPRSLQATKQDEPLVCVCLTDFDALLKVPKNEVERVRQQMALRQLSEQMQMTPNQLLELVQY